MAVIVVDTSAVIAYLRSEPEAASVEGVLTSGDELAMSAVSAFETRIVLGARFGPSVVQSFELFLVRAAVAVHPFDDSHAQMAHRAYMRFGKGTGHGANLNMGDCAAYALALSLNAQLLYVGGDFAKTDVDAAI
jgi:ribonuclease VapC